MIGRFVKAVRATLDNFRHGGMAPFFGGLLRRTRFDYRKEIGRAHVELQSLMRISYAVFCLKKNHSSGEEYSDSDQQSTLTRQSLRHHNDLLTRQPTTYAT